MFCVCLLYLATVGAYGSPPENLPIWVILGQYLRDRRVDVMQAANLLRPETVINDNDVQPASSCGVVLPVSQAEGWLWLRRTAPDEVAFAVHVRNWPNTALRSVHIHPGVAES